MGLELQYDKIVFKARQVDNASETVVEGSLTLPDGAPEIGRGLRLRATPRVTDVEVKDDKVVFEGVFDLSLLYAYAEQVHHPVHRDDVAESNVEERDDGYDEDHYEKEEVTVHERLHRATWNDELPFVFILDLPGITEGQEIEQDVRVRASSYDVRSDQVTLDVDVAIELRAWVDVVSDVTVVTGVVGVSGIDVETQDVRVTNLLGVGSAQADVKGELPFSGHTNPQTALELQSLPQVTDISVDDDVVKVKGTVDYELIYLDADDGSPQYARWPGGLSFEAEVSVDGARRGADANVKVRPLTARFSVVGSDDEGKSLDVYTPIQLDVQVVQTKRVPLVTSVTSEECEIAQRQETRSLIESVGEGSVTENAEASFDLPDDCPTIERVLNGSAQVTVEDVHVLGDRVAAEVRVDVDVLYVGRDEGAGGVYESRWPEAFTLDIEIPVPGAEPGLERSVDVVVRRVECDPINRTAVDVRVELEAHASLQRELEVESVQEAVDVPQLEEHPPTYTFVIVQPGDSLWKVAARYRSDVDAIAAVNPWLEEADDSLPVGRKLCVPRRLASVVG